MRKLVFIAILTAVVAIVAIMVVPYQISQQIQSVLFANEMVNKPELGTAAKYLTSSFVTSAYAAPELTNVFVMPTNNIVHSVSHYTIFFTTSFIPDPNNPGGSMVIGSVEITFPAGFDLSNVKLKEYGSGLNIPVIPGSFELPIEINGQTIRFDTRTDEVPNAGNTLFVTLMDIRNPQSIKNQVYVSTLDRQGNIIQGPTLSEVFQLKRITSQMILDGQIKTPDLANRVVTSEKISPSFMRFVQLHDDSEGNAKGWNPGGTFFIILDPNVSANSIIDFTIDNAEENLGVLSNLGGCNVVKINEGEGFVISCTAGVLDGATLNYMVINP